jgi:hypothetical protein
VVEAVLKGEREFRLLVSPAGGRADDRRTVAFPSPFAAVVTPLLLGATLDLGLEAFARLHGFERIRRLCATLSAGGQSAKVLRSSPAKVSWRRPPALQVQVEWPSQPRGDARGRA